MSSSIAQAFSDMGASLVEETTGGVFEIGLREIAGRETFQLTYPWFDELTVAALDVKRKQRHLVLDVTGRLGVTGRQSPTIGRYLCGHDERHWFVSPLAIEQQTMTVRGAMESLKPRLVLRAQQRLGVKSRLHRRKTAAYVRQGEWFFLPRPMMHVGEQAIAGGQLARPGGKPHLAQWFYQPAGSNDTFVRGAISHPDHATLHLQAWHRVVLNNEPRPERPGHVARQSAVLTRVMYFD